MKNIVLGPPGTGKTTHLLNIMEKALAEGMKPQKIGFISFTKQAIKEAKDRVKEKFNLSNESMANFRTLHSYAFRHLGLSTKSLMNKTHFAELADVLGIEFSGLNIEEFLDDVDLIAQDNLQGDRLLFLDGIARNTLTSLKSTWEKYSGDDLDFYDVERVSEGLRLYKQQYAILDYTDILEMFLKQDYEFKLDLLLIDEAQDLSTLQWKVVEKICEKCKEIYIAGDDDQAIFRWAGADIEYFINLQGNVTTLNHSYRLPNEVHAYSKNILTSISHRRNKLFDSTGRTGSVSYVSGIEELELEKGSWLILARSAYSLFPLISFTRQSSMFYSFKDKGTNATLSCKTIIAYKKAQLGQFLDKKANTLLKEYLIADNLNAPWQEALNLPQEQIQKFTSFEQAGEDLLKQPRIQFGTIHGAKGAEADNVVICPDLSYKAFREMQDNPEDEARVFYVGVTRAKENLYILTPQTRYYYEL